jgi:outer membrane protein assembly factor BamB
MWADRRPRPREEATPPLPPRISSRYRNANGPALECAVMRGSLAVRRALFAAALAAALLHPARAEAFIPSTLGPLQALLVILPQVFVAIGAGFVALFKPRTYRLLALYLWVHKGLAAALIAVAALLLWGPSLLFGGRAQAERAGRSWTAFRGGPERVGAVDGATGPLAKPRLRWHFVGDGALTAVDSSAAVVGNRVYVGAAHPSVFSPSGSIYSIDLETGARAWRNSDAGLRPVFSSPAVDGRLLVSGEGYHVDRDCRILCLEGGALRWEVRTTSHVESSPCIAGGRAYVGAGDDGLWCVDVETGRVVWRLEGAPFYDLEGEGLEELVGREATLAGEARRVREDEADEVGRLVLKVRPDGPRVATGKVVRAAGGGLRVEVAEHYPDVESSPAVVDGRVVFGCGIGGRAVACVEAATGRRLWRTEVPHPAFGSPTVSDGRVLIGLGNGNFVRSDPDPVGLVLCLSLADGRELWRAEVGDTVLGAIAVRDGAAYACSRDGRLHAFDAATGGVRGRFEAGAPLTCSPTVTANAVFLTTVAGKVMAVEREGLRLLWSIALTPGEPIYSSPVAAGDALIVGTQRGVYCLEGGTGREAVARPPRPWDDPARSGVADGPAPVFAAAGEEVDRKREPEAPFDRPIRTPTAACAGRVYAAVQGGIVAVVDAPTGRTAWQARFDGEEAVALTADASRAYVLFDGGALRALDATHGREEWSAIGAGWVATDGARVWTGGLECRDARSGVRLWPPAIAHNLVVGAAGGRLFCLSDATGATLWEVDVEGVTGPPTIDAGRIFVPRGRELQCRRLVDGALLWTRALEEPAASHVAAGGGRAAVALESGRVVVLANDDGRTLEEIPVGPGAMAPVVAGDLLIVSATNRVGGFDLASSGWRWRFRAEEELGELAGPPVVASGTLWAPSRDEGLVAIDLGEPLGTRR